SSDYQLFSAYQKQLKTEKKIVLIWQCLLLIGFFSLWELSSRLYWIDPLLFSSPSRIINLVLERFANGTMWTHLQITMFETILGFIIGTLLGIVLAIMLWASERFSNIMDPYLVIMNAMPKVALG